MSRLLLLGQSCRAAAQAAQRSGFQVAIADMFGDSDALALAEDWRLLDADDAGLPSSASAIKAVEDLATPGDRVLLLSGFESRPGLIAALDAVATSRGAMLLGNDDATVAAVKDPANLFPALAYLGIPYPSTRTEPPPDQSGWLSKQIGGAGGGHLRIVEENDASSKTFGPRYWQKQCLGAPASVQLLANGDDAIILGFCEQWTDPTQDEPFRFGGVALWQTPPAWANAAQKYALALSKHFHLKGLISVDLLVAADKSGTDDSVVVIEVNPRPGQSLDLFHHIPQLMAWHCAACEGVLPDAPTPSTPDVCAVAILYAPIDGIVADGFDWPAQAADIPSAGRRVAAGQPFISIVAHGPTIGAAKQAAQSHQLQALTAIINEREVSL